MRTVLASMRLGDFEDLTVSTDWHLLYLESSGDGFESQSVLDAGEVRVLRTALDRFLAGDQ